MSAAVPVQVVIHRHGTRQRARSEYRELSAFWLHYQLE